MVELGGDPPPGEGFSGDPIGHYRYPLGRGNAGQNFDGLPAGTENTVQWRSMQHPLVGAHAVMGPYGAAHFGVTD